MGSSTAEIKAEAKAAGQSKPVEWLGRVGLAAKGVSFAIVAVLALDVALRHEGRTQDRQGALRAIADESYGVWLLAALAAGFAAYALWRFVQAFLDRDHEGHGMKGLGKRASFFGRGVLYGGLFLSTMSVLLGEGGGSRNQEDKATAGVLEAPAGRWLVIAVGVGVAAVGVYNGYRAVTRKFEKKLRLDELSRGARRAVAAVGVLGHLARFTVFSIIGWFLVKAALDFEPRKAVGLDGALGQVAEQPYGRWLLLTVAAGILCYGIYAAVESRYRRV
ncbi:MAG: DUF1206 domain-containing protein [Actinomycetota bacterium]|nr:DUF1206 domain-containing protein [Actinomycetota bacterium]